DRVPSKSNSTDRNRSRGRSDRRISMSGGNSMCGRLHAMRKDREPARPLQLSLQEHRAAGNAQNGQGGSDGGKRSALYLGHAVAEQGPNLLLVRRRMPCACLTTL